MIQNKLRWDENEKLFYLLIEFNKKNYLNIFVLNNNGKF